MIKLDRRRKRKPKNEDEEEPERTEVDFSQDLVGSKLKLETDQLKGGLEIRRKSASDEISKPEAKEEVEHVRKGPAMPPPEVLAALQTAEIQVPADLNDKTESESETKPLEPKEDNNKVEKENDKKDIEPKAEFKAPSFPVPLAPAKEKETCDQKSNLPSAIYKTPKAPVEPEKEVPKFNYREPDWSDVCEDDKYTLEVLKGGKIIGKYNMAGKSTHVLGKLDVCDLKLEHPSISRYHLIFQWHKIDRTWKIMDFGSTHGVKMNKMRLRAHQYARCTVGSVLEIGLSTRKYVLNGPEEDQLKETEESGFELREKFKKKQKKLEKQMLGESDSDSDEEKKEESGVNWGFTEDAWEDDNNFDDIDPSKKPNFLKDQLDPNAFYNKDPLKAINHFFTSDNQEPPWILNQTPKGKWECKLELPIGDGHNGVIVQADGTDFSFSRQYFKIVFTEK